MVKDDLGIARIVLVPAVVQRFPGPGERHRRDMPGVEAGFDQAPRDGTVIVASRLESADRRLAIGSQRLDQAAVLGTRERISAAVAYD